MTNVSLELRRLLPAVIRAAIASRFRFREPRSLCTPHYISCMRVFSYSQRTGTARVFWLDHDKDDGY